MSPASGSEQAIVARGLRKAYRSFWSRRSGGETRQALAALDLVVPRGAAFGLIGANGAGKTTFVKSLLGVLEPDAGELWVLGGRPRDVSVRAHIGYVPERLALPAAFSARGYLRSVARLKRLPQAEADIVRQLERVGLAQQADARIGSFSKGMRQRLALAAALLGGPRLLVLDEPTDGVDPIGRAEIRHLLGEERARGATLLLNSHLLSETERICDRIAILAGGRIVREGSARELCGTTGRWRVRFEGAPAPCEVGFEAQSDGSAIVTAATAGELDRKLAGARSAGALLVELRPEAKDLELVLAEAIGKGGARR